MGVGLAMVFWQLHLQDEGQLHSYDAAHEHYKGPEEMCYLCGGCNEHLLLVPTARRNRVPRLRRKENKLLKSAPVSP